MNIRAKLLLPPLLGFGLLVALSRFHWKPDAVEQARADLEAQSQRQISAIESDLIRSLLIHDMDALTASLDYQGAIYQDMWRHIRVYSEDGTRLYPRLPPSDTGTEGDGLRVLHQVYPLTISDTQFGRIELDLDWSAAFRKVQRVFQELELALLGVMCLVLLVGLLWQYRLLQRPLSLLQRAADQLAQGDFQVQLPSARSDEVGRLSTAFRVMRDNLQASQDELIRAKCNVEAASQAKSEFLSTMSQEIRAPVKGMLGMAQRLEDTALGEEQKEYAQSIGCSGRSLLAVIEDIGDFAMIEAGRLELNPDDFDLERLAFEVVYLFSPAAGEKGFELLLDYPPDVPRLMVGDAWRIRQVISSLIANAIELTHQGHVAIRVRQEPDEGAGFILRIEVEDTGIGIPENEQATLFDAFDRAGSSTTGELGGASLGLAIARRLMGLMGGEISVQSAPGRGSTFTIRLTLPLAKKDQPLLEGGFPAEARAIVVDDNAPRLELMVSYLSRLGLGVMTADSLTAATRLLEQGVTPSLILVEHCLEESNAGELRELAAAAPILVTTSFAKYGIARRMMGDLVKATLARPFLVRDLLDTLHALTEPQVERPTDVAEALGSSEQAAPTGPELEGRILLVEDVDINRMVTGAMLQRIGLDYDTAVNGEEAVAKWRDSDFHLVLMDCLMPVMDGFSATRQIRNLEEESGDGRVPVVAMTAYSLSKDRAKCFAAGMDDFLSKPFTFEDFRDVLARWLTPGGTTGSD